MSDAGAPQERVYEPFSVAADHETIATADRVINLDPDGSIVYPECEQSVAPT